MVDDPLRSTYAWKCDACKERFATEAKLNAHKMRCPTLKARKRWGV